VAVEVQPLAVGVVRRGWHFGEAVEHVVALGARLGGQGRAGFFDRVVPVARLYGLRGDQRVLVCTELDVSERDHPQGNAVDEVLPLLFVLDLVEQCDGGGEVAVVVLLLAVTVRRSLGSRVAGGHFTDSR
jgi:hypothetical protein